MADVLVSVEHADGVAAIVRDRRGMWLAGRADEPSGLIDDARPRIEGLAGDRTAQGGRLPPGAVGAEVVDHAGARHAAAAANGAWIVVLDQPMNGDANPVRYVDAAGATVIAPVPAGPRTPIPDAPEPCPACGASGWDHVVPGGGDPLAICRACGHSETVPTFYGAPLREDEEPWPEAEGLPEGDEMPEIPGVSEEQVRAVSDPDGRRRLMLSEAGFPVYAVAGRPPELAGSGRRGDVLDSIEIRHAGAPPVTVRTERQDVAFDREAALARCALRDLHEHPGPWPDRSLPALGIWINTQERERRRLGATADLGTADIVIDGAPAGFTLAVADGCWAAVRRHGDLLITVTARDCAPAEIELDPLVG